MSAAADSDLAPPALETLLAEAREAARRIAPYVGETPVVPLGETGVLLKAESLHPTGAFKIRGAFNALLRLDAAARRRGVVAHSSGNHARAVAFAARRLGISAVVVMPADAPKAKAEAVRRCGAEIVVVGPASAERAARAAQIAAETGRTPIPPFDSEAIMAGTGTIALELAAQVPGLKRLFAPVSGGGLIAGVAAAAKALFPGVRVIGVEPELAADAQASLQAGRVVSLPAEQVAQTCADGLRVQQVGALTWPRIRAFVDEIVTVSEAEILSAMATIAAEARLVAEPSGAVAPAAALRLAGDGEGPAVALLSGGNVDPALLARALRAGP